MHKADIRLHLLLEADLLHKVLVVPKQPLMTIVEPFQ